MALVKVKPTSPGRRSLVKVVNPDLHKGKPHAPLLESQSRRAGRNNSGHITMRHQGGGHKQHYRIVDFKRAKDGVTAKVERLEYDPNRSANLALLCYTDGERRYIIAPKGVAVGAQLLSGARRPPDGARRGDEPGRSPAWGRRRQDRRRPASGQPLGHAYQGLPHAQEQ